MAQSTLPYRAAHTVTDFGRTIFIYIHVRTNRVVYSLTRTLHPRVIKEQIPFTIKKSVPPSLRKDDWRSLATVSFPSNRQGLDAFHQLREFRKRHEYEWGDDSVRSLPKRERARWLQDQKANTVADLAAVLQRQEQKAVEHTRVTNEERARDVEKLRSMEAKIQDTSKLKAEAFTSYKASNTQEGKEDYKKYKRELMKQKREVNKVRTAVEADVSVADVLNQDSAKPLQRTIPSGSSRRKAQYTMDGMRIEWSDITNAEYAETWPASVVHDALPVGGVRERHISASGLEDAPREQEVAPAEQNMMTEEQIPQKTTMQRVVERLQFGRR